MTEITVMCDFDHSTSSACDAAKDYCYVPSVRRFPGEAGLVQEPEQWKWSSYCSYAFGEEGMVKINLWPKAVMKIRTVA